MSGHLLTVSDGTVTIPSSPAEINGLYAWWDASQLQVAGGTMLSVWPDVSGNGMDFTQATTGSQPQFLLDDAGRPTLHFSGAQSMQTPALTGLSQPFTLFVVARAIADPSPDQDILGGGSGSLKLYLRARQLGKFSLYTEKNAQAQYPLMSNGASDAALKIIVAVIKGGSPGDNNTTRLRVNSAEATVTGMGLGVPANLLIGTAGAGNFLTGDICELGIYNRELTTNELIRLERYLS